MLNDMAGFIWYVLREPILAAIAAAALVMVMLTIATWFNFKSPTEEE